MLPTHPGPTREVSEIETEINKVMKEVWEGWDKATQKYDELVNEIRSKAWMMNAALQLWIMRELRNLAEGMKRLRKIVDLAMERHYPVLSLIITSFKWTTDAKAKISALSSQAGDPATENLGNWEGPAAVRYKEKVAEQVAGIDECTIRTEFISGWLFEIAQSNVEFAIKLAEIVTKLVGNLVDACVEAGTIIGLAVVANTIGDAAGELTEDGLNVLLEIGNRLIETLGNVRDLWGVVMDNTVLNDGVWPQAVKG